MLLGCPLTPMLIFLQPVNGTPILSYLQITATRGLDSGFGLPQRMLLRNHGLTQPRDELRAIGQQRRRNGGTGALVIRKIAVKLTRTLVLLIETRFGLGQHRGSMLLACASNQTESVKGTGLQTHASGSLNRLASAALEASSEADSDVACCRKASMALQRANASSVSASLPAL